MSLQEELAARTDSGIQDSYDHLTAHPPSCHTIAAFRHHVESVALVHNKYVYTNYEPDVFIYKNIVFILLTATTTTENAE